MMKSLTFASLLVTVALAAFNVAAQPVVVEARHPSGAIIQLHNESGPCVDKAKLATFIYPDKKKVQGCWKTDGSVVSVAWFDADGGAIPVKFFKPPETL